MPLCLQRPALFTERHFFTGLLATTVHLPLPCPVLTQSCFGVASVVEVDLRNLGLDEGPHTPV